MKLPYDLSCLDRKHWSLLATEQCQFYLTVATIQVLRSGSRSSQASVKSDFLRCSSALNSAAAKNADLGTHEGLARRRSYSCSFVYLKGWKIFSGIRNFVSKMSDRIKFQNHVPFNCIISLKLDFVYFANCKEQKGLTRFHCIPW